MKITYNGPYDAVEIAETGQIIELGSSVEVADELGIRLAEQSSFDAPARTLLSFVGKDTELAERMLNAELNGAKRAEVVRPLEKLLKIDPVPLELDAVVTPEPEVQDNPAPTVTEG